MGNSLKMNLKIRKNKKRKNGKTEKRKNGKTEKRKNGKTETEKRKNGKCHAALYDLVSQEEVGEEEQKKSQIKIVPNSLKMNLKIRKNRKMEKRKKQKNGKTEKRKNGKMEKRKKKKKKS